MQPFYALRHGADWDEQPAFWYASRRPSLRKGDAGTEVYLTLVNRDFQPDLPAVETLTVHVTCTNRDLPGKLPFGGASGDFELEGVAPLLRIRCLKKPTETLRPPLGKGAQWRLISHLSLNYLSLCNTDDKQGAAALRELLGLYAELGDPATSKQVHGLRSVASKPIVRPLFGSGPVALIRGIEVSLECDESAFQGTGAFLLGAVLERFFAKYVAINSFTETTLKTLQRGEIVRWPMKHGQRPVL